MRNIQLENHTKRENKLEENTKKAYEMIFKELFPHQMQTRIKNYPKYDSIFNDALKLMDAITQ